MIELKLSLESRRRALVRLLTGWTAIIAFPALYVVGRYLSPPLRTNNKISPVVVGRLDSMPPNTSMIVKVGTKPVIVVHTQTGEYKAFGATCTHLGCTIEYRPEGKGYFHCNCHGGQYDLDGRNISGPPPRPLTPYRISFLSDNIVVTTS